MNINKIYFDMDDTVADFGRGLKEICGIEPIPQDQSTEEQDDAMWAAVREAGDFYYELQECVPGVELFRKLRTMYGDKVEILTAVPKARRKILTAEDDKKRWVAEHFGSDVVVNITHSAEDKKKFVTSAGCFLVDDLKKNIDSWRAAGGTGIWFLKDDSETTESEVKKSCLLYRYYDPDFQYQAEEWIDGSIMTLYRKDAQHFHEEYKIGEGWKSTVEALEVFNGQHHPHSVSEDDVEEYLKWMEQYTKKSENDK